MLMLPHHAFVGIWLGDPRSHLSEGKKVWIVGVDAEKISAAESVSFNADKLAINLLTALVSLSELATGNCTQPKRNGIHLLDQKKIHGIRRKFVPVKCIH